MIASDPLSDVLSLLKPRTYVSAGLDAGGDWAIRFPAYEGIKFNAITRGTCWVRVEGGAQAHLLQDGDCFLLTTGRAFMLASDLAIPSIDSREIYDVARDGIATCNRGGEFFLVGGRFAFAEYADILFGALSPVVHVSASSDQASVLRWGLERFVAEIRNRQPGGLLIAEHLAHIMLVQVPRVHLQSSGPEDVGWMFALSNPRLSAAVSAMHSNLAHRWTLQELARLAGMSRSTFALKFKQAVGTSPLEYLTR